MNQQFSIVLDGVPHPIDSSVIDRVFSAGCNDCTPCIQDGVLRLDFDREAAHCFEAFDSASKQLLAAGFNPRLVDHVRPKKKKDARAFKFSVMPWGQRRSVVLFFSRHPTWEEVKDAFALHSFESWGGVPCGETPDEKEHSKLLRDCGSIIYKACGDVKVEGFGSEFVPPPKKKPYIGIVSVGEGQVQLQRSY